MSSTSSSTPVTTARIQAAQVPRHVAIIMDGNNRWARSKGLTGVAGHRAGAESARDVVDSCISRNIDYLTLFAFSSENWLRPYKEVKSLMALFLAVLKRSEITQLHKKNVRLQFIGNRNGFSAKLQAHMAEVEKLTANNTGTTVIVAADYGGHWDIAMAARKIAEEVEQGRLKSSDVTAETLGNYVCLGDLPMPDLCIRTGGENRISNFLLWQFAYTELYFTECYWPDFGDAEFQLALDDYAGRQRRFGHLDPVNDDCADSGSAGKEGEGKKGEGKKGKKKVAVVVQQQPGTRRRA